MIPDEAQDAYNYGFDKGYNKARKEMKKKVIELYNNQFDNDRNIYFSREVVEFIKLVNKLGEGEKCSICNNKAVQEIQVIWKGKEKYIPRCKKHIVNNYKGEIKRLEKEEK